METPFQDFMEKFFGGPMNIEEKFKCGVKIIQNLPQNGPFQPSHEMMLKFYGLYKQAVEGPCCEPKPAFYEVVKGYKWRAWKNMGDMPKTKAMESYVEELKKIIETMSYTQDVANFIDALGPFYEFIDVPAALKPKNNNNDKGQEDDSPSFLSIDKPEEAVISNGHGKINGNADSDLESGSEEAQTSSSLSSSPELVSVDSTCYPVPLSLDKELQNAVEEEDEDDEELVVMKVHNTVENTTTHTLTLSPKVYYSDSESDEEYSEPAEVMIFQMNIDYPMMSQSTSAQQPTEPVMTRQQNFSSEDTPDTPVNVICAPNDVVICGGGDQSHPGGLQMTPHQTPGAGCSTSMYTSGASNLATPGNAGSLLRSSGSGGGTGGGGGGEGGGGGRKGSSSSVSEDVNAQLVILLRRLQNDMENVLHRLNTLETLTVNQHHTHCHHCQMGNSGAVSVRTERSWWPFPELSPRSTFFLLIWPLLMHGGVKLLLLLRSRRRRQ